MDSRAFELLVKMISDNKNDQNRRQQEIRDEHNRRLQIIETKIDRLAEYKAKIIGGSIVITGLVTLVINLLAVYHK